MGSRVLAAVRSLLWVEAVQRHLSRARGQVSLPSSGPSYVMGDKGCSLSCCQVGTMCVGPVLPWGLSRASPQPA